jgi:hypothetical protein
VRVATIDPHVSPFQKFELERPDVYFFRPATEVSLKFSFGIVNRPTFHVLAEY